MLQNINLEEVKQYNATLKQYKDKAATLNVEIEYTTKELDSLCAELTAELGVQVTKDNIEQIYNEQVEKINSTLNSGKAVLAKIANEENSVATANVQQTVPQPVQPVTPQVTPQAPLVTPQFVGQPVQSSQQVQSQPVQQPVYQEPVQGTLFSNQPVGVATQQPQELPPLFSINQ